MVMAVAADPDSEEDVYAHEENREMTHEERDGAHIRSDLQKLDDLDAKLDKKKSQLDN